MPNYTHWYTPAEIDRENNTVTTKHWRSDQCANRARELANEIAKYAETTGEVHPFANNGVNHLVSEVMAGGVTNLCLSAQRSAVLDRTPHQIFWGYYDGGKNNWEGMITSDPDSWDNHNEARDALNGNLRNQPDRRSRPDPDAPVTRSTNNFRFQFIPIMAKLFDVPETVLDYWVVIPPESKHRGLMTHLYEYFDVNRITSNKQYKHGSTSTTLAGVPNLDFSAVQFYGVPKKYSDTEFSSQTVRSMIDSRIQNRDYRIGDWYCTKIADSLRWTDVQNHEQGPRHQLSSQVVSINKTVNPDENGDQHYFEPHWYTAINAPII